MVDNASLVFYRTRHGDDRQCDLRQRDGDATTGTVILTGSNTYTGTTTIAPSSYDNVTLQVGNGRNQPGRSVRAR